MRETLILGYQKGSVILIVLAELDSYQPTLGKITRQWLDDGPLILNYDP